MFIIAVGGLNVPPSKTPQLSAQNNNTAAPGWNDPPTITGHPRNQVNFVLSMSLEFCTFSVIHLSFISVSHLVFWKLHQFYRFTGIRLFNRVMHYTYK